MTPKSKPGVELSQTAFIDLKRLQGNVRRQMIIAINALELDPRPFNSKPLEIEDEEREIRRLRLGKWRIIYVIIGGNPIILGIRKRPPYDYDDLNRLVEEVD